jgi:hypothetical protein
MRGNTGFSHNPKPTHPTTHTDILAEAVLQAAYGSLWHQGRPVTPDYSNEAGGYRVIVQNAGLDWEVEQQNLFDETQAMLRRFAVWCRSDNGDHLGIFGTASTLQNDYVISMLVPLLETPALRFDVGGFVGRGREVWLLLGFRPGDDAVRARYAEAGLAPYILLRKRHPSKRILFQELFFYRGVTVFPPPAAVRNCERSGEVLTVGDNALADRHLDTDLVRAFEDRARSISARIDALAAQELGVRGFGRILDKVLPAPPEDVYSSQYAAASRRWLERREAMTTHYYAAARAAGGAPSLSRWAAYIGAVCALELEDAAFPNRGERLNAVYPGGTLDRIKRRIWGMLCRGGGR